MSFLVQPSHADAELGKLRNPTCPFLLFLPSPRRAMSRVRAPGTFVKVSHKNEPETMISQGWFVNSSVACRQYAQRRRVIRLLLCPSSRGRLIEDPSRLPCIASPAGEPRRSRIAEISKCPASRSSRSRNRFLWTSDSLSKSGHNSELAVPCNTTNVGSMPF